MSVVNGLEAVQIDQTQCERLAGLLCDYDPVSEQALKAPPVGEPGQIVGQRYGHRRFSRLLGNPLHFGDRESRLHDLGEHAKVLVEHPDDQTRGDGDQRREAERQARAASDECNDEDRGCGDNDHLGLARDPVEAHCANGGHNPDDEERQRELDHAILPGRDRSCQRECKRQRRPEHARRAHLAPDAVERLNLDAGARLEPRRQPEYRHADERRRQEEAG